MAKRKRTNLVPDEISVDTVAEVSSMEEKDKMDTLLNNLVDDIQQSDSTEEKEEEKEEKQVKKSNDVKNKEDLKSKEYNIISKFEHGDRVKLKANIKFDMLGHRIHNGIRNYVYTVRLQRDDDLVIIECLTIILTVKPEDIEKVYL